MCVIRGYCFSIELPHEKVSYAKRMAQGYLKSMGMGEFTPKSDMYSKESTTAGQQRARWKKMDDDQEFEFDI